MTLKYRCSMAEDYSQACKNCRHAKHHTWIRRDGKNGSCSTTYCWVKGIECRCDPVEKNPHKQQVKSEHVFVRPAATTAD